jgi:hypothetical protein
VTLLVLSDRICVLAADAADADIVDGTEKEHRRREFERPGEDHENADDVKSYANKPLERSRAGAILPSSG